MAKSKFMLTEDLVKVEPEFQAENSEIAIAPINKNKGRTSDSEKERISLNIDSSLKMDLQIFCVKHKISMSEFIEEAIRTRLEPQKGN